MSHGGSAVGELYERAKRGEAGAAERLLDLLVHVLTLSSRTPNREEGEIAAALLKSARLSIKASAKDAAAMRRLLGLQPTGRPSHSSRDQAILQHVRYLRDQGIPPARRHEEAGQVYGVSAARVRRIVAKLEKDDAGELDKIAALME